MISKWSKLDTDMRNGLSLSQYLEKPSIHDLLGLKLLTKLILGLSHLNDKNLILVLRIVSSVLKWVQQTIFSCTATTTKTFAKVSLNIDETIGNNNYIYMWV